MRELSYMLLISLLSFSCEKKGTLKVTVTNVGTGKPMANNGVYITELTNKVDAIGTITHDFYNGTTNADGLLYIDKKFDKRYTYEVFVDLPDNWAFVEDISHTMSVGDNYWKNGMDFKIANAAYLKLNIHNINCQGVGDHFVLYSEGTQVDITNAGLMIDEMGCYQYNPPGYSKIPMGGRYYRWEVTRNGITTTFRDTAYFAEGENKTYTINY